MRRGFPAVRGAVVKFFLGCLLTFLFYLGCLLILVFTVCDVALRLHGEADAPPASMLIVNAVLFFLACLYAWIIWRMTRPLWASCPSGEEYEVKLRRREWLLPVPMR